MRDSRSRRGVALIAVLWVVLLLSVIAGSLAMLTRTELGLSRNLVLSAKAEALAEGGIHLAINELLVPDAKLVMRCAGSCVAVARAGMTRVHRFTSMLDLLPKDKFLGKVLNQVTLPDHPNEEDEEHEDANEETN